MYGEQMKRVRRWLERIELPAESQTEHEDFLWSFFQNCWHLKDWIKNDPTTSSGVVNGIESDINRYDSLKISADLANGSKHLVLLRPPRHAKNPQVRGHISVVGGPGFFDPFQELVCGKI